ncbi:hypothetical protein HPP92_016930 [Vanilla planifolia]|uniref:DYW domain-containing protein n=1 Tax=Vanilla planifolia TaxID=51239 RepID=A0A835URR1_VANPL|nr:hypothetical protein HPP92_016930 [Vanilla planifolia]
MAGYVDAGRPDQAVLLLRVMCRHGVEPNSFTISTAIDACSQLANARMGRELHSRLESLGLQSDVVASTALINMYGKVNDIEAARRLFDGMALRNVYTWGTMISLYAQNARGAEALCLFSKFSLKERPNHFMISSIVNACAGLGRSGPGRCAHAAAIRLGYEDNEVIAGALVDMYAKCGHFESSRFVFARIAAPTLVPYTSMIISAAKHGLSGYAFSLLDEMLDRGVQPNSVTFLGILHACSHSGLTEAGLSCLKFMQHDYGVVPVAKHYTCVVDMLGRAGRLNEALELACRVDASGDDCLMLWCALLSAARVHGRLDVVAQAGTWLAQLAPGVHDVAGAYVAMSNAYHLAGLIDGSLLIRKEMKKRGIRKDPGCSWVEVKGMVYVFYARQIEACPRGEEVMMLLRELKARMVTERSCNTAMSSFVLFDVDKLDSDMELVRVHSEILAMAFGILSFPIGGKIRIMKNLRICGDCHGVLKVVSKLMEREFVVRDLNRFHHFKGGSCSCWDYW